MTLFADETENNFYSLGNFIDLIIKYEFSRVYSNLIEVHYHNSLSYISTFDFSKGVYTIITVANIVLFR